ncbi:uncharacterized mitochondrial protein AtMg00820-like [Solanum tuberosum]|uniref:uncharacterized mitochondrial protein AtMg00820-like n=1 Tax=Solanum tuberosum TaxID=4113 RepID=UPI000739FA1D|nr:PREDICTED: uncharacterized mitochondrial protein AtMg00820-like [Solanum tuberosum]
MITRHKAKEHHLSLVARSSTIIVREPNTTKEALRSPQWLATMHEEIDVLHTNKTWVLVPKSPGINLVGSKWVFKTKLKDDGTVDRYKARLVARGFSQFEEIDFEETFSLVVKVTTIGIEVKYFEGGIHLNQSKYVAELLAKTKMTLAKAVATPLAQKHGLHEAVRSLVDASLYKMIVGSIQYLTLTRPDITHASSKPVYVKPKH